MKSIVPQSNHRLGEPMFIAQGAEAGRSEQEVSTAPWFESEPASGEHPQEMPAREQKHVPLDLPHSVHNPVGPDADLIRRFPFRTAVVKQLPVRALHMDLGGAAPLVLAVVPFEEVAIDFGDGLEAGQLACQDCAL